VETRLFDFHDGEGILKRLEAFNADLEVYKAREKLKSRLHVILIGGAGLILRYHLERATRDIDVLEAISGPRGSLQAVGTLMAIHGFHIVSESLLTLHPDYEARLEKVADFSCIEVYTLSAYDYAITKLGRGSEKDMDDILHSGLIDAIDIDVLKGLYFDAMSYWIGDERRFRGNWELFKERIERGIYPQT
jgi:hypothetical protein